MTVEEGYVDVIGPRGDATLYAEVKGRTASPGLEVDTLYGQLPRRVPSDAAGCTLAVVIPDVAAKFAERVPETTRAALAIHTYSVSEDGNVKHVGGGIDPARSPERT